MARSADRPGRRERSVPRPRGDGPNNADWAWAPTPRSPPARGWPAFGRAGWDDGAAFPARAGMARSAGCATRAMASVPRPRGDGPSANSRRDPRSWRSPPARGWPATGRGRRRRRAAFPARAGMAADAPTRPRIRAGVPRPRGDGPAAKLLRAGTFLRSPPARGWPIEWVTVTNSMSAFPARAGMARSSASRPRLRGGVPRPRGDGPIAVWCNRIFRRRSPPARGWPGACGIPGLRRGAFPARAGMARPTITAGFIPYGVPRPRGDGPSPPRSMRRPAPRSPPARGWPDIIRRDQSRDEAFPARAGMARTGAALGGGIVRVPRPRGDGPLVLPR